MDKAQGDYLTATREFAAHPANYDAVCFHAQQCIEKLLKAALILNQRTPPKAHDLVILSRSLSSIHPEWRWPVDEMRLLSRAAVIFRYPGETAGPKEAEAALMVCKAARDRLLSLLTA